MNQALNTLLQRTNLSTPFDDFLKEVVVNYPVIGQIVSYQPISEGYEDANIALLTSAGKYVLKIFRSSRTTNNILDYVKVIHECLEKKIPTIKLVNSNHGELSMVDNDTYYIICNFFDGHDFTDNAPSRKDMVMVVNYLAQLNTIPLIIEEEYDSWGNKNLFEEFQIHRDKLTETEMKLIEPVVRQVEKININSFPKSLIHGDMQRKHILKNAMGEYCILDFGCMSYAARVFDLSTYIAWFCFGPENISNMDDVFIQIVKKYKESVDLSQAEIESLPDLIRASCASYFMKTSILIRSGDTSDETKEWNELSHDLLIRTYSLQRGLI